MILTNPATAGPFADQNREKIVNYRVLPEPHHMTSLDDYTIEERLTENERAAHDRGAAFCPGGSPAQDCGLGKRAAVVQLTGAGSFDIPDASRRCE
jgi:hypothetical protein